MTTQNPSLGCFFFYMLLCTTLKGTWRYLVMFLKDCINSVFFFTIQIFTKVKTLDALRTDIFVINYTHINLCTTFRNLLELPNILNLTTILNCKLIRLVQPTLMKFCYPLRQIQIFTCEIATWVPRRI